MLVVGDAGRVGRRVEGRGSRVLGGGRARLSSKDE